MTVKELISILNMQDQNMQVIVPDGCFYIEVHDDEVHTKELYPDLSENDNSTDQSGEKETYLVLTTNQFSWGIYD